mmetsp:Transcript_84915/g.263752  ORF Transcript_84915/g.263752 Transcript_84915/m.263752 type:complete len:220 (+) Transcript_84915:336-995(+)
MHNDLCADWGTGRAPRPSEVYHHGGLLYRRPVGEGPPQSLLVKFQPVLVVLVGDVRRRQGPVAAERARPQVLNEGQPGDGPAIHKGAPIHNEVAGLLQERILAMEEEVVPLHLQVLAVQLLLLEAPKLEPLSFKPTVRKRVGIAIALSSHRPRQDKHAHRVLVDLEAAGVAPRDAPAVHARKIVLAKSVGHRVVLERHVVVHKLVDFTRLVVLHEVVVG